jgi:hypothetical protein
MIVKLILTVFDGVSWAFFFIVFGFSFYYFLENNGDVPPEPIPEPSAAFKAFISLAFIFKVLDIVHLIIRQSSVDLFLIDWEREKPLAVGDQGKLMIKLLKLKFPAKFSKKLKTDSPKDTLYKDNLGKKWP